MEIEYMFYQYITSQKAVVRLKQTMISTYYRNSEAYIKPFSKRERLMSKP